MRTLFFFILVAVWLYFIVEASMTRNPNVLPRYAWVLLTLFLPGVGTLLWFVFGRQRRIRSTAPDDDPRFLRSLDDEVWKKRLRDWRNRGEGK
ncbi:MAG: PLDc N-terminal domain-containing protein [Candidatus Nanopelagicales bacterium]